MALEHAGREMCSSMLTKIGGEVRHSNSALVGRLPDARQWLTLVDFGLYKSISGLRQHGAADRLPEQDERRRQRMALRYASLELAHKRARALPVACHHVAIDELAERAGVLRVERTHALKACDRL